MSPCISRQILNHCATREAHLDLFLTVALKSRAPTSVLRSNVAGVLSHPFLAFAFPIASPLRHKGAVQSDFMNSNEGQSHCSKRSTVSPLHMNEFRSESVCVSPICS